MFFVGNAKFFSQCTARQLAETHRLTKKAHYCSDIIDDAINALGRLERGIATCSWAGLTAVLSPLARNRSVIKISKGFIYTVAKTN